jgi:hypothetical protein
LRVSSGCPRRQLNFISCSLNFISCQRERWVTPNAAIILSISSSSSSYSIADTSLHAVNDVTVNVAFEGRIQERGQGGEYGNDQTGRNDGRTRKARVQTQLCAAETHVPTEARSQQPKMLQTTYLKTPEEVWDSQPGRHPGSSWCPRARCRGQQLQQACKTSNGASRLATGCIVW